MNISHQKLTKWFSDPVAWRGWAIPVFLAAFLFGISQEYFLLFHTMAELFAIIVAIIMSVVAWQTYQFSRNHFLMYLGCGYFWIAALDLFHTLSYKGMGIFDITDGNTSIHMWLVARFAESLLLLTAPWFLTRKISRIPVFTIFGIGAIAMFVVVMKGNLPLVHVEGSGLTDFKIFSEYVIIALLGGAALLLAYRRNLVPGRIFTLTVSAIVLTIFAEIFFTFYVDLFDHMNALGHVFKFFSFWLIFEAIVSTTLQEPYEVMARGSSTYDAIPNPTIVVDGNGIVRQVNRSACRFVGMEAGRIIGRHAHELFHPKSTPVQDCAVCRYIRDNEPLHNHELFFPDKSQWYGIDLRPIDNMRYIDGVVHVMTDLTERKISEIALKRSNESLELSQQKLRLHFEDTPLGVVEWDPDFRVASWNPTAEKIFGYKAEEAIGRKADFIIIDSEKSEVEKIWNKLVSQAGGLRSKNQNVTKSGEIITCEWYNTPLVSESGEVIGVASLVDD
ncbi:MAG: PAS domain S-box protein, partial [Gammaproteobacteria bacterium]|nr:PAS domain S-box protein [Gammaproteobacteria bacterium]